jgi:hypothetical protein
MNVRGIHLKDIHIPLHLYIKGASFKCSKCLGARYLSKNMIYRIPDNGQSPQTQWFSVLYTTVRTFQILLEVNSMTNKLQLSCNAINLCLLKFRAILYFSVLLHSFYTEYFFFCPYTITPEDARVRPNNSKYKVNVLHWWTKEQIFSVKRM